MSFGSLRAWIAIFCAAMLLAGCGGGGGTTTPNAGEAFSLVVTANPPVGNVGPAGLRVTFFVVASGGIAPYTYAWDFNADSQTDLTTASGMWLFTEPGLYNVRVTVVDNGGNGDTVTATRQVTVNDDTSGPPADNMIVRFNASPQSGDLGFTARFQTYISGGKEPYSYKWDFDCDLAEWVDPATGRITPPTVPGTVPSTFNPDAYVKDPSWTYARIGPHASDDPPDYTVYPVLQITDGTGKVATNLDDILNNSNPSDYTPDGIPDFALAMVVLPRGGGLTIAANANPMAGQAPLTVEFFGSVTGGSGEYEFMWNFGEGSPTGYNASSIASHTYLTPGNFSAFVTVRDTVSGQVASSAPLLISATVQQQFQLHIISDIGNHPGGYYDESGTTTGFGIPAGFSGNVADGTALWNQKRLWNEDPPVPDPAGNSCATCHPAGIQQGKTFQQFAAILRGTTHGQAGQEQLAPNGSDLTDDEIADLAAYSNEGTGFEFATGEVPFVVEFSAMPINGTEPIVYQWDVFNEYANLDEPPSLINPNNPAAPPELDVTAVVTPNFSYRKNPGIHFASTGVSLQGGMPLPNDGKNYGVRCVARDAAGNTAISNIIRISATKHAANNYYLAHRPLIEFMTFFPADTPANGSANPLIAQIGPFLWPSRANPAVATHPSGISFIIGGEHLDENGDFEELVERTDSMYMYIPETDGTGTGEAQIGKFNTDPSVAGTTHESMTGADTTTWVDATYGRGGSIIALNANTGPAFPNTPNNPPTDGPGAGWPALGADTRVPPDLEQDPDEPVAHVSDRRPTSRSGPFTIVGSAAAVLLHEPPETNPGGLFPGPGAQPPDGGGNGPLAIEPYPDNDDVDQDIAFGTMGPIFNPSATNTALNRLYAWPDSPPNPMSPKHWQIDDPSIPTVTPGLGAPVIFVIGGRTDATTPVDLVQKYHVYGFGAENVIPWSIDYQFQTTGNQTDIWSNFFLREDTDQFVGPNSNFDPEIDDRRQGGQDSINLPRLPVPLYGLMACKIETGIDVPPFSFPYGSYRSVFIFGGIDNNGSVRDEMRWWNVDITSEQGDDVGADGVFSVVAGRMPSPRAYGRAVFIPTNPFRVALVGGFDQYGVPLNTVDIYEFASIYNPTQGGTWSTFAGTLPEALEACGAGYSDRAEPNESWVLAFGGWTGSKYSYRTYNSRLRSAGNLVLNQAPVVVPRSNSGSSQAGAGAMPSSFDRYYMFGGTDENGVDSIVEVFGLP